jgi:DNA-binding MarR family transcriptional regulator
LSREQLLAEIGAAMRAMQTQTDNFDQAVADLAGLNRTDMRCLDLVDQAGGMTAGELARAANLTTGAVTAVVDRLERAGLASRVRDPEDRRKVRIEASPHNAELAEPVYGPLVQESFVEMERYSEAELELIRDFLRASGALQARHVERVRGLARAGTSGGTSGAPRAPS